MDEQCTTRLCLGVSFGGRDRYVCSTGCSSASDCPLNFTCSYLAGMNFCISETIFTPPQEYDTRAGGACSSASITCQSGWCNTQAMSCVETCNREADCAAFGGNCHTGPGQGAQQTYANFCVTRGNTAHRAPCTLDSDCFSGICDPDEGRCAAHCCSDSDCLVNESCSTYSVDVSANGFIVKTCAPRTAGAGVQPMGAACTSFADCESEVCAPASLAMGAPRQCSTFCCTDADCSAVGATGRCMVFGPSVGRGLGGPTLGDVLAPDVGVGPLVGICVDGP
jgi:hypothetical protein